VPLSRRLLMQAGIGSLIEAFALSQQLDVLQDMAERPSLAERVTVSSPAHLQEILDHLGEQWYVLVKTDNLLGPRFALTGVLNQIGIVEALLPTLRDRVRLDAVSVGAQYAESAAWLYEDSGNMPKARYWTGRAMEWAYEADDRRMLAWTIFRRSQQVAATRDAARAIALAQAARRDEEQLATPTRAVIRVQEAYGYALDSDELTAQHLIDDAHAWAASDTVGDARGGHGSYCTSSYIEIQRANCWLTTGKPKKAITLYEDGLRNLPPVYQRNHAQALSWLATAYVADGQVEQAASIAHAALPVARSSGSRRTHADIRGIGTRVAPHRSLPAVAALLDDLASEDA
jgi:ATP/maltotriose-dependent transcriptional regulator MalT